MEAVERAPAGSRKQVPAFRPTPRLAIGTGQSVGIERSHNEDSLLVVTSRYKGREAVPSFGLFVVADGMGGHRAGEVASAVSVRTVARRLTENTALSLLNDSNNHDQTPLQELLREALEEANQAVVEQVPGGGTTLTAAVLLGGQLTIGHVGDSRAYLLNGTKTEVITRDHSLVERLKELGQLTPEEAATHPQRNVLYRAIGQGANLEVDVQSLPAPKDGFLMICSDGLWGVVDDHQMETIIRRAETPQAACDELVRAANRAGGPDNISVVLVRFPGE